MEAELRNSARVRTLLRGRAVFRGGYSSVDCLIVDISDGGARLKLSDWRILPNRFSLAIANGSLQPVEICHRSMDAAGVRFLKPMGV